MKLHKLLRWRILRIGKFHIGGGWAFGNTWGLIVGYGHVNVSLWNHWRWRIFHSHYWRSMLEAGLLFIGIRR